MRNLLWFELNYGSRTAEAEAKVRRAIELLDAASDLRIGGIRLTGAIVTTVPGGSWLYPELMAVSKHVPFEIIPGLKTASFFRDKPLGFADDTAWGLIAEQTKSILAACPSEYFAFDHETSLNNHRAMLDNEFASLELLTGLAKLPKATKYIWYPGPVRSNDEYVNDFYWQIFKCAKKTLRTRAFGVDSTAGYPLRLTGALAPQFEKLRKLAKYDFKTPIAWPMLYFGSGKHPTTPEAIEAASAVYAGQVGEPECDILNVGFGSNGDPLERWIETMKGAA